MLVSVASKRGLRHPQKFAHRLTAYVWEEIENACDPGTWNPTATDEETRGGH